MSGKLAIANEALKEWSHAIETGIWEPYLSLLTEDYTFWLPEGGYVSNRLSLKESKEQLVNTSFNQKRIKAYNQPPDRVSVGDSSVVFEFIFDAGNSGTYYQNCMALSFDVRGDKIAACREYHCVLMIL